MDSHTTHNHPDKTPQPGTFTAVLADPPWQLQQKGTLGAANHYDLMTDQRILGMGAALKEMMADNSFCFLWVTTATVPLGIQVLEAWGFKYTSFYFWAKPRLMLGNTFRNSGELLLLGVRGKGTKVAFKGQPNWGMHPLQQHSAKPEEVHQIAERLVGGDGPFLELFARRPAPSAKHWDIWGNECDATISLAKWGYPVPADTNTDAATRLQDTER
ncbi:MT-A70 family methyltransferase [Pseudoclavibacter helvolus]|uniref:MT-A70 family methyltransferase n=1 Tax=Pseudoclavibacter helvolus TaxID=255205 RepID=UPI0024AD5B58|nr:MT-A70 family methyltransferase [Pseudoclavibacter helvolus]